jgi:hypothetical protein
MLSNNLKTIGTKILKPSSFLKSSSLTITSASPAARHFLSVAFGGAQKNALVHIQTPIKNAFSAYTPTAPVLEPSSARFLSTISAPVNDQEAQVKEQRQEFSALSPDLTNKLRAEFEVRRAARDQRFLIKTFE